MRFRLLTIVLESATTWMLLASCAAAAVTPTTQISSKAVEKDGLSVQVSLEKSEVSTDEQPQFAVRFANVSKEFITLYGADEYWNWKVRFTNVDPKAEDPGPWLLNVQAQFRRHLISTKNLKPGDFVDVPVDINNARFPTDFYYYGPFDHLIAPIKHLKPGTYKMTIEIALEPNPVNESRATYWTGPVTSEATELKVVKSGERNPATQPSPKELHAYEGAIDRLVNTFGPDGASPLGMWTNGLTPPIPLPKDAKPEDVITAAAKKSLLPEEFKTYRILHIRNITADKTKQSVTAAVIQTVSKTRIVVFFPFKDSGGWWTRLYETDLNAVPAAATAPTTTQPSQTFSNAVERDGLFVQVSLKKSDILADEPPQFTVRFTNGSDEYINLCGAEEYWDWKVRFTNLDQKADDAGPWLLNVNAQRIRHLVTSIKLKPGDFIDVPVDLDNANFKPEFAYDGVIKHLIAPVKHLKAGTHNMRIEIALQPDPLDKSGAKYWTGPVTTGAVELKVVESAQRGPATQPLPRDLAPYDDAIDRVLKALAPGGLWVNGIYPSPVSRLAADAQAQDVIADAVNAWYRKGELRDYRILRIRENVKLPPDFVFSAAVIQAGAEYKVLLFRPSTGGGWWAHFYDTDLHSALPPERLTDPNVIAVGDWSDEVDGLRGRLLLANGRTFADGKLHETVAYLELRNSPDAAGNSKSVYFDPDISCEMLDPQGATVPQGGRGYSGGGGGRPSAEWVTLPYDSTIRLRLSPYGYGSEEGLRIDISRYEWNIKSTDKGEYTLSATFTSDPEQLPRSAWLGTLKLPGMKIAIRANAPKGK